MSRGIGGRERHAIVRRVTHRGIHTAIENLHLVIRHGPVPDLVKEPLERLLFLPVDLLQIEMMELGLAEHFSAEKIGRLIEAAVNRRHFPVDDRRQLEKVPEKHHLDASERLSRTAFVDLQGVIDPVHQVRAHHGSLVHDQKFQGLKNMPRVRDPSDVVFLDQLGREPEKGMDRLAAAVDGRDPRRRQDDVVLFRVLAEIFQERGLAGTGLARDIKVFFSFSRSR